MFSNRPKRDRIKPSITKIQLKKVPADHRNTMRLGVIERRATDIRPQNLVIAGKRRLQLMQKRAGGAADIQHLSRHTMLPEKPQLPFEAYAGIIAFELGRGQIVVRAFTVVIFSRRKSGWH